MFEYYIKLKYRIEETTDAFHDGEYKFASTAAQTFEVSVQTLQRRLVETHISLFERKSHEYVLNTKQRKTICIYLTRLNVSVDFCSTETSSKSSKFSTAADKSREFFSS